MQRFLDSSCSAVLLLLNLVYVTLAAVQLPEQDCTAGEGLQMVQRMAQPIVQHFGAPDINFATSPEQAAIALQSSGKPFWQMVQELEPHVHQHPNKAYNCSAQVVIDVGLPRSGTTSFTGWAELLGYKTFHYLPGLTWRNSNYSHFFLDLFARYPEGGVAFADSPWAEEACTIAKHRPLDVVESKVKYVSMLRDPKDWLASLRTMRCKYTPELSEERCRNMTSDKDPYLGMISAMNPFHKLLFRMDHRWCDQLLGSGMPVDQFCSDPQYAQWLNDDDLAAATAAAEAHSEEMRACVGAQNMLVVHLEQEGKEHDLAEFLGCQVDVPAFPSAEDGKHV